MAPSKIPIWSCFTRLTPTITLIKVVKLLSKTKFNGKENVYAFDHVLQFIINCSDYDIDEGVIFGIFTLTLTRLAKYWCQSLLVASVPTWDEFTRIFIHAF